MNIILFVGLHLGICIARFHLNHCTLLLRASATRDLVVELLVGNTIDLLVVLVAKTGLVSGIVDLCQGCQDVFPTSLTLNIDFRG